MQVEEQNGRKSRLEEAGSTGRDFFCILLAVSFSDLISFGWVFFLFFVGNVEQFGLLTRIEVLEQYLGEWRFEHAGMAGAHLYAGAAQCTCLGIGNGLTVGKGDGVYGTEFYTFSATVALVGADGAYRWCLHEFAVRHVSFYVQLAAGTCNFGTCGSLLSESAGLSASHWHRVCSGL